MRVRSPSSLSLTMSQQELVRANLGLVGVHIRQQRLRNPGRRKQEWNELFQEGCLGLIEAARLYCPDDGIAFAAFALPRIHQAVRRYLIIEERERRVPCLWTAQVIDVRRQDPFRRPKGTIGARLRRKYDRAVRKARRKFSRRTSPRGDRMALIDRLVEERWLIPEEGERTSLREIARQTKSSYSRVQQCDIHLALSVRGVLEQDPEVAELRRLARRRELGMAGTLGPVEREQLAAAAARAFLRTFQAGGAKERGRLLYLWSVYCDVDLERLLVPTIQRLPPPARRRFLRATTRAVRKGQHG